MNKKINLILSIVSSIILLSSCCECVQVKDNQLGTRKITGITDLNTEIQNAKAGETLDFSQWKGSTSGTVVINKQLSIKNITNVNNLDLSVTSKNVSITGSNINSVNTSGNGANGLKIANSSLSSLTIGNSSTSRGEYEGRGENIPTIKLVGSVINDVTVDTEINLEVYNFTSTIPTFNGSGKINFKVSDELKEQALWQKIVNNNIEKYSLIDKQIDRPTLFTEYSKVGPAGKRLKYQTGDFPQIAIDYVHELPKQKNTKLKPFPSIAGPNEPINPNTQCKYMLLNSEEMLQDIGLKADWGSVFKFRCVQVLLLKNKFKVNDYKKQLTDNFTKDNDNNNCYIISNIDEAERKLDNASSNPFTMSREIKKILDDPIYFQIVTIDESDTENYIITFTGITMTLENAFNLEFIKSAIQDCSSLSSFGGLF